jgi:hypothetical protein
MPRAERYFKKLKDNGLVGAFNEALDAIEADPYSGELKIGDLAGIHCRNVFYNRTNYEIAYRILEEDGEFVIIILAGTRENFYRELKRYMNS